MFASRPAVHPVEAPPLTEAAGLRVRMKDVQGMPGTPGGLVLRLLQFVFAAIAVSVMASTSDFHEATAFCYLVLALGLQSLWSLSLLVLDIYAILVRRSLRNDKVIRLFTVGDGITSTLTYAAACSSAGITVLISNDLNRCGINHCTRFETATAMAFISFIFFISLWLKFCTSIIICLCIVVGLQSEKQVIWTLWPFYFLFDTTFKIFMNQQVYNYSVKFMVPLSQAAGSFHIINNIVIQNMSNEQDDERRLYQCVRKYKIIVKQFDELIEMMSARTKPPKRRRVASRCGGSSSNAATTTAPASSSQPDQNEVFVQTISRFLQDLRTESDSTTDPHGLSSTRNQK